MKLIIAEKPSVAGNIAHALGVTEKVKENGNSYYKGEGYYIANAVGHLYDIGDPTDYGYSNNFRESYENGDLPIYPEKFMLKATGENTESIRRLLHDLILRDDVDEIICATDAAREGELIFRQVYEESGTDKPFKRLWIQSVTDEAILQGMKDLKDGHDYDGYYRAAKTREELDWIYGMNLSRLYTALDTPTQENVGRVMTPLLGLITARDTEIENFKPTTSYVLGLDNGAENETAYDSREEAEQAKAQLDGKPVTVQKAEKTQKKENRPQLFSLTTLQMEANRVYGYTADEVLECAQDLYDSRLLTYPRTDAVVVSEDMRGQLENTVNALAETALFGEHAKELMDKGLNMDKRVVNNEGLTDHHAIIPTIVANIDGNVAKLAERHKNIYILAVNRMLAALDEPYTYEQTDYTFACADTLFSLKTKVPVSMGWRKWIQAEKKEEPVYDYAEGQTVETAIDIKERVSTPKKHYTDETLLSVMQNIDNRIEGDELKNAVKGKGLGTPATRAGQIAKLVKLGYVERKGKSLISTKYGRDFTASLPRSVLSVERTAEWELTLTNIEQNKALPKGLIDETKEFINSIIAFEKDNKDRNPVVNEKTAKKFDVVVVGKCPRCGSDVISKKDVFGCSSYKDREHTGCGFIFSKKHRLGWYLGEISDKQAEKLLKGETVELESEYEGKRYKSKWMLEDKGDFANIVKAPKEEKEVIGTCPRCQKNIYEGRLNFYCASGMNGCGWTLWKEDKHNQIKVSKAMAKKLLADGTAKAKKNGADVTYKLTEREYKGKLYVNLDEVK